MIYPNISLKDWMNKIPGLEPQKGTCSCGKTGMTTVPVMSKDWVGLAMPQCTKCGNETPSLVVKARTKELQAKLNSLF